MTAQEITELAAILVNEHDEAALAIAEQRRDQYARERHFTAYRLWARIAIATAHLLRLRQREKVSG